MDLNDMLKEHQLWLDKARQALTHAPAELGQPRIEHIKARIAELKAQKEREIRRYDAAIAELDGELAGLSAKTPPDRDTSPPAAKKKRPKKAKK